MNFLNSLIKRFERIFNFHNHSIRNDFFFKELLGANLADAIIRHLHDGGHATGGGGSAFRGYQHLSWGSLCDAVARLER